MTGEVVSRNSGSKECAQHECGLVFGLSVISVTFSA